MTHAPDDARIAAEILTQARAHGPGRSISPSEVAQALDENWRPLLGNVRRVAAALAQEGQLEVLRKGRAVAPGAVKGVIRLRIAATAVDAGGTEQVA